MLTRCCQKCTLIQPRALAPLSNFPGTKGQKITIKFKFSVCIPTSGKEGVCAWRVGGGKDKMETRQGAGQEGARHQWVPQAQAHHERTLGISGCPSRIRVPPRESTQSRGIHVGQDLHGRLPRLTRKEDVSDADPDPPPLFQPEALPLIVPHPGVLVQSAGLGKALGPHQDVVKEAERD